MTAPAITSIMAESAEHTFLKDEIEAAAHRFARTRLFGLKEANRSRFDLACTLERDFSRGLEVEVCWGNKGGLAKDLHNLFHGGSAPIKLLVVRGSTRNMATLDEMLRDYRRSNPSKLTGLRVIDLPDGFDADDEVQRVWMKNTLERRFCSDLLFGVVFGHLGGRELRSFLNHGGPIGLKTAILSYCSRTPIWSMSGLQSCLQYNSNSPIREALVMLTSTGLLHQMPHQQPWLPTLKGRFLLDLMARALFESSNRTRWSPEMKLIFEQVATEGNKFWTTSEIKDLVTARQVPPDKISSLLVAAIYARTFGVDLASGVRSRNPIFYSPLDWERFESLVPGHPFGMEQLLALD